MAVLRDSFARQSQVPAALSSLQQAQMRFAETLGGAFATCDWLRPIYLHFVMPPEKLLRGKLLHESLQLDLHNGQAVLSLMWCRPSQLRIRSGQHMVPWQGPSLSSQAGLMLLGVCVNHQGERGTALLQTVMPAWAIERMDWKMFGVTTTAAEFELDHQHESGKASGKIGFRENLRQNAGEIDATEAFAYQVDIQKQRAFRSPAADSLEDFLLERYTYFTMQRGLLRRLRMLRQPMQILPISWDASNDVLRKMVPDVDGAKLLTAHYSPGITDLSFARPECLAGTFCNRMWMQSANKTA